MARKVKTETNIENATTTFTILDADGNPHPDVEPITMNLNDYSAAIQTRLGCRGMNDVGQDTYAGVTEPEAIRAGIVARDTALRADTWTTRGEGGGARSTLLAHDIVTATGNDLAAVIAFLADKTKDEKTALRNDPSVAVARAAREKAAATKAEKAAKDKAASSDGSGNLFAGLDG